MRSAPAAGRIGSRYAIGGLGAVLSALALAACSSSPSAQGTSTTGGGASQASAASSSHPGTAFGTASVAGLGTVVVDGRGRTVYVLTADGHTNLPCTDASGCTKYWPDLPFPDGTSAATARPGIDGSLLGSMKLSDGETYPTYHGWLMYEYAGDSAAGQTGGQLVKSFGGTWYALSPSGDPITTPAGSGGSTTSTGGSGGGGGGYGY